MTPQEMYVELAAVLGESRREVRRRGFQPVVVENLTVPNELPLFLDWDEVDRLRHRLFPE